MIVSDFIQNTYTVYRGKGATKTPVFGSEKSNIVLEIANRKVKECLRDSDQTWTSTFRSMETEINEPGTVATTGTVTLTGTGTYFTDYQVGDKITVAGETVRTIDAITSDTVLTVSVAFTNTASALNYKHTTIIKTGVKEYSLHRNFFVPSDTVTVRLTGQDLYYSFAKPQARENADVYISGLNPRKVTFYNDIPTQAVGGSLLVPGHYLPNPLVNATDTIEIPDENWLIYATAAELCRNDPAKDTEFANLIGMANDLYRKMVAANNNVGFLQDNQIPVNIQQISPDSEDWSL